MLHQPIVDDGATRGGPWSSRSRLLLAGAAVALTGAVLWLFAWPPTGPRTASDAVVVLSGPSVRLETGQQLVESGLAPTLVVSNGRRQGWNRGNQLCDSTQSYEVLCFRPRPQSTAGEARSIAELAAARGWQHVTVVTSPSHITRARMLVRQCIEADVTMISTPDPWRQRLRPMPILRETVAVAAGATVVRAC